MRPDEEKMVAKAKEEVLTPAERIVTLLIWLILAAFTAGVLFASFHLYLWVFAAVYKLSVHFQYLP